MPLPEPTMLGVDHHATPLALRERMAAALADSRLLHTLHQAGAEAAMLSTCNRLELYVAGIDPSAAFAILARVSGVSPTELEPYVSVRHGPAAADHLFAVAAGLESRLFGETQILAQVREAHRAARNAGTLGTVLDGLFRHALTLGRRARGETAISRGAASVGSAAAAIVRRERPDGCVAHGAVVGAGAAAERVLVHLRSLGIARVDVLNRTPNRAERLVLAPGRAAGLEALPTVLAEADVVAFATGSPHPLVSREDLARALERREPGRPLLLIDLALPRDVDPEAGALDGVRLYDIDHVLSEAAAALENRSGEAEKVRRLIVAQVDAYTEWLRTRQAGQAIARLRTAVEARRVLEVARATRGLGPREREAVDRATRAVSRALLHGPTVAARHQPDVAEILATGLAPRRGARVFRVGTRASALARTQTDRVVELLKRAVPGASVEVVVLSTEGDERQEASLRELGGAGVFVKRIEWALLAGEIDIAVHSLKDVPTALEPGLVLAAFPEREDPRDALVLPAGHAPGGDPLEALPPGARVGTGSARRAAQILAARPDLRLVDVRGNVDTRLRKLDEGAYDALILAAAGLLRLGRGDRITRLLEPDELMPMVGQGALAVETRTTDREARRLIGRIDDPSVRVCVEAERAFLRRLGGGCDLPVGALAALEGGVVRLRAVLGDGRSRVERREVTASPRASLAVAAGLAGEMLGSVQGVPV